MRVFEEAGVPRSERTISQWCRPNRHGERRLDAYYDEGERRYRITRASVARAIAEERAKQSDREPPSPASPTSDPPNRPTSTSGSPPSRSTEVDDLESEILNLRIDNKAKEQIITQLNRERRQLIEDAQSANHRIGSLETELRLLGGGSDHCPDDR